MSSDDQSTVDVLLARWEDLRRDGIDATADELCSSVGRDELAAKLAEEIYKLKEMERWGDAFNGMTQRPLAKNSPEAVGEFRVVRRLGSGAIGVVYLCEQASPKRQVAVKVLRSTMSPNSERGIRLKQEADILAMLNHPGIAKIFEYGEASVLFQLGPGERVNYLCMEYVKGKPLNAFSKGKTTKEIVQLVIDILDAVSHAHQEGVIHRDIKPSNVMVTDECVPKLLDFGIAKLIDPSRASLTSDGSFLGSMHTMSPEQLNNPTSANARSDVYSVSAMAYELLTGKLPLSFKDQTFRSACRAIEQEVPPLMSVHNTELRGDLDTIIAKGLRKNPKDRYQSASEFAADLRRFIEGRPVLARPLSILQRLSRWATKNPAMAFLSLAFPTLLVATSVFSLHSASTARRQTAETIAAKTEVDKHVAELTRVNFNLNLSKVADNLPFDPLAAIETLDDPGQCPDELREFTWQLLRQAASQAVITDYSAITESPTVLHFSEGERSILFMGFRDGRWAAIDAKSYEVIAYENAFDDPVTAISSTYDGALLAVGSAQGEINVFDTKEKKRIRRIDEETRVKDLGFEPKTSRLVAVFESGRVATADGPSYEKVHTIDTGLSLKRAALGPNSRLAIVSTKDREVAFIDIANGKTRVAQNRRKRLINGLSFVSPTYAIELSGIHAHSWNVTTGRYIGTHNTFLKQIKHFKQAGPVQVASSRDGAWFIRDERYESGARFHQIQTPGRNPTNDVAVSHDGKLVAFAVDRRPIVLWNLVPLEANWMFSVPYHPKAVAVTSKDNSRVLIATEGGELQIQAFDGRLVRIKLSDSRLRCLSINDEERTAAVAGRDGIVYLVDIRTTETIAELRGHDGEVETILFLDGDGLLSIDETGRGIVWDLARKSKNHEIKLEARVRALGRLPDHRVIAVDIRPHGFASCYDYKSQKKVWEQRTSGVTYDLVVAPDGASYTTCTKGGHIQKWDAKNGTRQDTLVNSNGSFNSIALSPDGRTLATVNSSGNLDLWDPKTGTRRLRLDGHRSGGNDVKFSRDGKTLSSVGADHRIRIWQIGTDDGSSGP